MGSIDSMAVFFGEADERDSTRQRVVGSDHTGEMPSDNGGGPGIGSDLIDDEAVLASDDEISVSADESDGEDESDAGVDIIASSEENAESDGDDTSCEGFFLNSDDEKETVNTDDESSGLVSSSASQESGEEEEEEDDESSLEEGDTTSSESSAETTDGNSLASPATRGPPNVSYEAQLGFVALCKIIFMDTFLGRGQEEDDAAVGGDAPENGILLSMILGNAPEKDMRQARRDLDGAFSKTDVRSLRVFIEEHGRTIEWLVDQAPPVLALFEVLHAAPAPTTDVNEIFDEDSAVCMLTGFTNQDANAVLMELQVGSAAHTVVMEYDTLEFTSALVEFVFIFYLIRSACLERWEEVLMTRGIHPTSKTAAGLTLWDGLKGVCYSEDPDEQDDEDDDIVEESQFIQNLMASYKRMRRDLWTWVQRAAPLMGRKMTLPDFPLADESATRNPVVQRRVSERTREKREAELHRHSEAGFSFLIDAYMQEGGDNE